MSDDSILKNIIVPVFAVAGAVIGVWNLVTALVERKGSDKRKDEDDLRFIQFCHQQKSVSGTLTYSPTTGSEDHLWAERMVERGKFSRMSRGMYEVRTDYHSNEDYSS